MTDPSEVGASGRMNEDDAIGDYLLDNVGDVDSLLKLGGDAPSANQLGIPSTLYEAYANAAYVLADAQPNCNLDWSLLASIGRIESNHARHGKVDIEGNTTPNILGPVLNGGGFAAITDTDGGRYDGDDRWDRAVGAMQFIPSTWEAYKADGNDDGVMNPHNVFDETVAAGKYLCSGNLDLSNDKDRAAAVFRYNHSDSYVATVLLWADAYADGFSTMPDYDVPDEDYYPDDYNDGGNVAQGPSSNGGTTQPTTTPTTNQPGTSTSTTTPTTTRDGSPRPTLPPSTTCTTAPTTTTTETTPTTTTESTPVPTESTTTTTETTTTTTETTTPAPTC